jgi:chromosomal replication initiator protein
MSNLIYVPQPPEIVAALRAAGCGILRRSCTEAPALPPADESKTPEDVIERASAGNPRQLGLATIRSVVSLVTAISVNELVSERRHNPVCRARQIYFYVARKMTPHSLPSIGRSCGGRDHSTVLHGCQKVAANREAFEPELSAVMAYLQRRAG